MTKMLHVYSLIFFMTFCCFHANIWQTEQIRNCKTVEHRDVGIPTIVGMALLWPATLGAWVGITRANEDNRSALEACSSKEKK